MSCSRTEHTVIVRMSVPCEEGRYEMFVVIVCSCHTIITCCYSRHVQLSVYQYSRVASHSLSRTIDPWFLLRNVTVVTEARIWTS